MTTEAKLVLRSHQIEVLESMSDLLQNLNSPEAKFAILRFLAADMKSPDREVHVEVLRSMSSLFDSLVTIQAKRAALAFLTAEAKPRAKSFANGRVGVRPAWKRRN